MKTLKEFPLNPKLIIASLWIAMMFIFAYVDIFGFFRADILEGALAGNTADISISQGFLLFTTAFVAIPTLMIPCTLIAKATVSRMLNLIVATLYIVAIIASAIGEPWHYYWLGSILEIVLLLFIIRYAWKWPRLAT